jgi:acyl carrier protein
MERLLQELRAFIIDNFLFGDASGRFTFTDDDSFQQRGIVDSTGILELVCHLQERYGIDIDDAELVPDNLDSVSKVASFVERKQSLATPGTASDADGQRERMARAS